MKIRIDIDCTPEEARAFMGLPDVKSMQDMLVSEMEKRMRESLGAMDPETLLKTWLPAGMKGFEQMQKLFWANLAAAQGSRTETEEKE